MTSNDLISFAILCTLNKCKILISQLELKASFDRVNSVLISNTCLFIGMPFSNQLLVDRMVVSSCENN